MSEDPCLRQKQEVDRRRQEWEALIAPDAFSAGAAQETWPFTRKERELLKTYMAAVRALHDCLEKHTD